MNLFLIVMVVFAAVAFLWWLEQIIRDRVNLVDSADAIFLVFLKDHRGLTAHDVRFGASDWSFGRIVLKAHNINYLLGAMVAEGYLRRSRNSEDEVVYTLTATGAQKASQIRGRINAFIS